MELSTKKLHQKTLTLCQEQVKRHRFGSLAFLSFVGTRPWFGSQNSDYDYRGIYTSFEEKSYHAAIGNIYVEDTSKDVILMSLERFMRDVITGQMQTLLFINSPVVYSTKEFSQLRIFVNQHPAKQIYRDYIFFNSAKHERKSYLYWFLEYGNILAILQGKKVIPNLKKLNETFLKLPVVDSLLQEENSSEKHDHTITFHDQRKYQSALKRLLIQMKSAYTKTLLPQRLDIKKLNRLAIIKKINPNFWSP